MFELSTTHPPNPHYNLTAEKLAIIFFNEWYCENGLPLEIISDCTPQTHRGQTELSTTIPFSLLIMTEIENFLCIDERQISFLSIPRSDIERLAVSPFQWIRYVLFAICGARGDLCTTPNGPVVAYEDTEIPSEKNKYYYLPSGNLFLCV